MDCNMPGLPVLHQLLEFTQTRFHWVGDAIQPSHPLSLPSPRALNLSQHQSLFQWVGSLYQVAKVSEFQLYCGVFTQWVGFDDWLIKVSWLGKLALVFWCVELDFFSLECNGVSSSEFWDGSMCEVWLWAACMLTLRAMSLRCWRIYVVCLALELTGSWGVVGFSVGVEAFGQSLIT